MTTATVQTAELGEALRALVRSGAGPVQVFREGRNTVFSVAPADPRLPPRVVVKRFGPPRGLRALSERLRGLRAERAFRIASALFEAGVPTPRPLGWVVVEGVGHFATEELPGARTLREVLDAALGLPERRRPALAAAARTVRALHDAGFVHGDLTSGNVLLVGNQAYLIDLNRARRAGPLGWRARARDLARLRACECRPLRERPRGALCGFPPGCQRRWLWEAYAGPDAAATERVWLSEVRRAKLLNWIELYLKRRWPQEIAYRTRPLPPGS